METLLSTYKRGTMLNRRHKTKLKELSRRIKTTEEVFDITTETIEDARIEIEELLTKFDPTLKRVRTQSTSLAIPFLELDLEDIFSDILRENTENSRKSENFNHDHSAQDSDFDQDGNYKLPKVDEAVIPGWAKKLRKEISKKCHPDMMARLDISEAEKEARGEYLIRMNQAIEDQDWDLILVIGINLDIYTDDLPPMNQKRRIQKVYQRFRRETSKLRETIAYQWSESWGNTKFKVDMVVLFLQKKGLPVPEKLEIIKIVKQFEDLYS